MPLIDTPPAGPGSGPPCLNTSCGTEILNQKKGARPHRYAPDIGLFVALRVLVLVCLLRNRNPKGARDVSGSKVNCHFSNFAMTLISPPHYFLEFTESRPWTATQEKAIAADFPFDLQQETADQFITQTYLQFLWFPEVMDQASSVDFLS